VAERVYIHIGAPKTGTTYLQEVMSANRKALRASGVLYPRMHGIAHHPALWDLRRMWRNREFDQTVRGSWDRAVSLVRDWDGPTAVLSSELFVYAESDEVGTALSALSDVEVHVVYTARDLARQVPAVWQERIRNQRTMPYDDFVADVLRRPRPRSNMARTFWKAQNPNVALRDWSKSVNTGHVHVVTMPRSGAAPDVLWNRFASVIGLDGTNYDAAVPPSNPSFGILEAETLRRVNERSDRGMSPAAYRRIVRQGLFDILTDSAEHKTSITLTRREHEVITRRSRKIVERLKSSGYDIVGDLAELIPAPLPDDGGRPTRQPHEVADREVQGLLIDAVLELLRRRAEPELEAKPLVPPQPDDGEDLEAGEGD
jgi:hypothetical protein